MKTFKSILEFQKEFSTDEKCREYLEQQKTRCFLFVMGTQYYLLASLQGTAIMHWMNSYDNRISVLKPGFPAFEKKQILKRIEAMYPVLRK